MRFILGVIILLFLGLACAKKNVNMYLQQDEIALAQPRIVATSSIIDSSVIVTASLRFDGIEIFYTNDGSEPTLNSRAYKLPLKVDNEGIYKFRAFHAAWKPSETVTLTLYKQGIVPDKMVWHTKVNENYKGKGSHTLMNQEKATLNFKNSEWQGFDSTAIAEVFFKKRTFVKDMGIGYLIDTQSWIFPPSSITIYANKDTLQIPIVGLDQAMEKKMQLLSIAIGQEVSSIKIEVNNLKQLPDWHDGKGNKAWLFMDEWIFN